MLLRFEGPPQRTQALDVRVEAGEALAVGERRGAPLAAVGVKVRPMVSQVGARWSYLISSTVTRGSST